MFKWLQVVFKKPADVGSHPLFNDVNEFVKENNKTTLSISEPVTSFLKCFKENPRRFKLSRLGKVRYCYTFTDTKTNEKWTVADRPLHYGKIPHVEGVTWMTEDERELIASTFVIHYAERARRLHEIRLARHTAKMNKERDRLTQIYKVEK